MFYVIDKGTSEHRTGEKLKVYAVDHHQGMDYFLFYDFVKEQWIWLEASDYEPII